MLMSTSASGNGFLSPSDGVMNTGLGGAGLAQPMDASGANINPALSVRLPNQLSFSSGFVYQNQYVNTYEFSQLLHLPPNTTPLQNKRKFFPIGLGGVNYHLQDDLSISISWGGGGAFTKYGASPISSSLSTARNFDSLAVMMPVTVSWRPVNCVSYGASVILGYANLQTSLTNNDFQETKGHNHLDNAVGIGAKLGVLWDISDLISVGSSITSPVVFTKFNKYSDVISKNFSTPLKTAGGVSFHLLSTTDILFDVEGFFWKTAPVVGNSPNNGGQGWRNTYALMTGISHRINPVSLRLGYQYSLSPVRKKYIVSNLLSPINDFAEHLITAGVSMAVSSFCSLSFDAMHAFQSKLSDPQTKISIKGSYDTFLLGLKWNY